MNQFQSESKSDDHSTGKRRLAIIGCGSSGLICLKTALATLAGWNIVCFEKSNRVTGCWGDPYPGFVSTSTRYTTQFSCFPERDAQVEPDAGNSRAEFYRGSEYGQYLSRFADSFNLHPNIKLCHQVEQLTRTADGLSWSIKFRAVESPNSLASVTERFDVVVICTGLAAQVKQIESTIPSLSLSELSSANDLAKIQKERIVVFGGGESAVDYATRLSQFPLENQVYLSLRTGVRVSPRYHPIGGVPSDFLRNRLMLSIDPAMRNWIGQRFVESRILYEEQFKKWFPSSQNKISHGIQMHSTTSEAEQTEQSLRKEWAYKLTKAAKDDLFNMFHNKSDNFLECVAKGRITIVGPPVDSEMKYFFRFQSTDHIGVHPTKILPAIGYKSTLHEFAGDSIALTDFYLGCCHVTYPDLYLVGFARPIIGNIPTISEMQAEYVCGLIGGRFTRPKKIAEVNLIEQQQNAVRFSKLDLQSVYPVEMFPYCDRLARQMNLYPSVRKIGSVAKWWRMQLTPATTMHYQFDDPKIRRFYERAPVYMPVFFILLLLLLKPIDWVFRAAKKLSKWR